jgi:hypothetical protein
LDKVVFAPILLQKSGRPNFPQQWFNHSGSGAAMIQKLPIIDSKIARSWGLRDFCNKIGQKRTFAFA